MEELEEEIISEETIIGDEKLDFEYTDLDNREWEDDINPNESVSQISQDSGASFFLKVQYGSILTKIHPMH
jgi:hypothetical protein